MKTIYKIAIFLLVTCITYFVLTANEVEPNLGPVLSGFIKDAENGETLIGASVYIQNLQTGTVSNLYGYYSLNIPKGSYHISVSFMGYEQRNFDLVLENNTTLNIELKPNNTTLSEVTITDRRTNEHVREAQMGSVRMNTETIKKVPALMGEVDVLKTLQLLPGIQNTADGFSGFSVRGGASDHNMILLDEAVVYNASHLLGFFSVFNSDAIKDMTVYKGDIPAHYGGRLASVLDIRMKDGNSKRLQASGGVGSISSRLTLETPLKKDVSSILISGRRTYADIFLPLAKDTLLHNNKLFFYDLNMKANYTLDSKNRIYFSAYLGRDVFAFRDLFGMNWGNSTQTFRWNRIVNEKLFSNMTLVFSDYDYSLDMNQGINDFIWNSSIKDYGFKTDFNFYPNTNNTLRFGYNFFVHVFHPGTIKNRFDEKLIDLSTNTSLEHVLYVSNEQKVSDKLTLAYGIRNVLYQNIGESKVFSYDDQYTVIDSVMYKKGELYNTYAGIEPRMSLSYMLHSSASVKSSYSRTRQYVQLASNSAAGMPIDFWFPCSPNVSPQISDQVSVGYFKNLRDNTLEFSVETYYKYMQNQIDFKDNAQIYFNDKLEGEIRTGKAYSYGVETMLRKQVGSLSGWISYTYSKARREIDEINNGNWYDAGYDKPHNVSVVVSYDITERINVGATWIFTSGTPITLPTGKWTHANTVIPSFSDRNSYRLPDYHRMDFSATIQMNRRADAKVKQELNLSCYNVYNRKNPFTIFFEADKGNPNKMKAYQMSMFGIVPSVTWNFKF